MRRRVLRTCEFRSFRFEKRNELFFATSNINRKMLHFSNRYFSPFRVRRVVTTPVDRKFKATCAWSCDLLRYTLRSFLPHFFPYVKVISPRQGQYVRCYDFLCSFYVEGIRDDGREKSDFFLSSHCLRTIQYEINRL